MANSELNGDEETFENFLGKKFNEACALGQKDVIDTLEKTVDMLADTGTETLTISQIKNLLKVTSTTLKRKTEAG